MRLECRLRTTENILGVERTEVYGSIETSFCETRVKSGTSETNGGSRFQVRCFWNFEPGTSSF